MAAPVITGSTGSVASGTSGGVTPAVPDGNADDDILYVVGWGSSAAASITDRPVASAGPASLTYIGSIFGGTGAYGTDTGSRGFSCWKANASSTLGSADPCTFTNQAIGTAGTRVIGAVAIRIDKTTGKLLTYAFTGGIDTNAGDGWAPSGQTDIGGLANDLLVGVIIGVPQAVNPTPTLAWTGLTVGGAAAVRSGAVSSGAGLRFHCRQAATLTGGPSSGAPTGPSGTTGLTGVMGFIRVRETDPPVAGGWQTGSYAMGH